MKKKEEEERRREKKKTGNKQTKTWTQNRGREAATFFFLQRVVKCIVKINGSRVPEDTGLYLHTTPLPFT